jgi:hypothetical protein
VPLHKLAVNNLLAWLVGLEAQVEERKQLANAGHDEDPLLQQWHDVEQCSIGQSTDKCSSSVSILKQCRVLQCCHSVISSSTGSSSAAAVVAVRSNNYPWHRSHYGAKISIVLTLPATNTNNTSLTLLAQQ